MTHQRSNAPMDGIRTKPASSGSRSLHLVVTSAAIPAVFLSSGALAQPATAAPSAQVAPTALHPGGSTPGAAAGVPAGGIVPAALVASHVPTQRIVVTAQTLPAQTLPAEYTVRAGDTIEAIAKRHELPTDRVLSLNSMDTRTIIRPGQKIKLTGSPDPADEPAPAPAPTPDPAPSQAPDAYTVQPGDTLGAIAARNDVSLQDLLSMNRMSMTTVIRPGQTLALRGPVTTQGAPDPAPAPAPAPDAAPVPGDLVASSFLGFTYPDGIVADANANKALLNALPAPSPAEMKQIVADTAGSMGVDPSLALAFAFQESGFDQRAVSPANAIGTMQVIPSSGQWASDLVGRELNLLDPYDNATAGVAIIRSLLRTSPAEDIAIASYYQGAHSVRTRGMFEDTEQYVAAVTAHRDTFR